MNLYCITCLMFTKNDNATLKCEIDGKINLIKEQETSRILSSLRLKTPLNKIPLVGPILS